MAAINDLIALMQAQFGKPYQFGAPSDLDDTNPAAFDCSGLICWSLRRFGVFSLPDHNSSMIYRACIDAGTVIGDVRFDPNAIAAGVGTRGALLIRSVLDDGRTPCEPEDCTTRGHIVVSLGNGRVIEAMQTGRPVGEYGANPATRVWTAAVLIPGISYAGAPGNLPGNANPRNRPYLMHDFRTEARNYRGGDRRDWVRRMQQLLIEAGHLAIPGPTGNFRNQTEAAVVAFQQRVAVHHSAGFAVDGECGRLTWGWLLYLTGHGLEA